MFDGRVALRMPLPPEIAPENRDFTAEAWLRFDPWQPGNLVHLMNVGSLAVFVAPAPNSSAADGRELHLTIERTVRRIPLAASAQRWLHLALVRQGSELRLYLDGQPVASLAVSDHYSLDGPLKSLVFGQYGGGTSGGFSGLLRDFRVSKVARYSAPFSSPLRSLSDSDTVLLPHFTG